MSKQIESPIFDIQRFSIHDGPGIRTLIFFKGCLLNCKWCQNPESQQKKPVVAFYQNRCASSFDCKDICPENAIMEGDFRIDYEKCTNCGKCVDACAYGALKLIGNMMEPEALFAEILRDTAYYSKSGGGVTFSGGEPTLYPEFLDQILDLCREKNIHTTLETCGFFSFKLWQPILQKLDLIYFDLKIIGSQDHKLATGVPNTTILKNAQKLAELGFPVEFRMPLIEGHTDSDENIRETILLLKQMKQTKIHLLKYHNMGESKIDIIQGNQEKLNLPSYSDHKFDRIKTYFNGQGIEVCNA